MVRILLAVFSPLFFLLYPSQAATISGEVFNDINGNGALNAGEPGLSSWVVRLLDNSNTVLAASTTDAGGSYSFTVTAGSYIVSDVLPSGWITTTSQSVPISATDQAASVVNFGAFQIVTISGQVFNDLNSSGVRDAGEPGLQGWAVSLLASSTILATTTTDAAGSYSFGVGPGTFQVLQNVQPGWTQTTAAFAPFTTASGVNVSELNFGDVRVSTVPEPGALPLLLLAFGIGMQWRLRRHHGCRKRAMMISRFARSIP